MVKQITQIQHAKYQSGGDNDGYPNADSYDPPVSRDTFGWYPQSSQMSPSADYNRRVIDHRVILVPDPTVYTVRDQITFPGDDKPWFVSEDVGDYTNGPFEYRPGGEIVVEKVSG
ncbi:hypothetical protein A5677_16890 [Mycobacterium malmoense]|uniref:Head-to-tail stopper n=1 Tax=Mycobacterium malmoense TaxID=1780 RepID=A0A1B9DAB1_MYCMA|nr:hypothetical protein [Mycobacterium malmoense]OCB57641.1 hypothetical protein A5677_16890 [Mycobacterium malmoense]